MSNVKRRRVYGNSPYYFCNSCIKSKLTLKLKKLFKKNAAAICDWGFFTYVRDSSLLSSIFGFRTECLFRPRSWLVRKVIKLAKQWGRSKEGWWMETGRCLSIPTTALVSPMYVSYPFYGLQDKVRLLKVIFKAPLTLASATWSLSFSIWCSPLTICIPS